jgi:hypothetical protein
MNYKTKEMKDLVITTEYEGQVETRTVGELSEFLYNMFEISNGLDDFINKVDYGLTDETSRLDDDAHLVLTTWYISRYFSHEVE